VGVFYRTVLGKYPDSLAFFDYAVTFSKGFGRITPDATGGLLLFMLVYISLAACALKQVRSAGIKSATFSLATLSCLWVVSSYYIIRSHNNNLCNLFPFLVVAAGAAFESSTYRGQSIQLFPRAMFASILLIGLIMSFGLIFPKHISGFSTVDALQRPIESRLPRFSMSDWNALQQAGVRSEALIAISDFPTGLDLPRVVSEVGEESTLVMLHSFLPGPFSAFEPLSKSRRISYLERFMHSNMREGFFVARREQVGQPVPWIFEALQSSHKITAMNTVNPWTVWRFSPRAQE
jgi:hypothetical protein